MTEKSNITTNPNKIKKVLGDLNNILEEGRLPPGQKSGITHVSMGGNKGKFSFNKSQRKRLNKIVYESVSNGIELNIAELPKEYGPIIFDIDLDKKQDEFKGGRLYDDDMIVEVVEYYREAIQKFLDVSDEQLKVCIFEKSSTTTKQTSVRDGFHGCFHEICTSSKVRHLIRNFVVSKANESETFSGFGKTVEQIFDKAIISTAPWLMYGCKKPDGLPYLLTKVLDTDFKDYGSNSLGDDYQKIKMFSIQQKTWNAENSLPYVSEYNQEIIDKEYDDAGFNKPKVLIEQPEDLPENKKANIEKAKVLVSMLKDARADNYHDWIRVGWALHNVNKCLLAEWIEFSQRSDKFEEGKCEDLWLSMRDNGLTISSLVYWAKEDSPQEYKKYMQQEYDNCIRRSLDTNTYYIAKALHNKYSDRFVCVSLKMNVWYEFKNHKWTLSEGGTSLLNLICEDFIDDFHKIVIDYNQAALKCSGAEKEDFQTKASKTQKIIDRLLNINFKKQIMEEAKNLFYDCEFVEKLDDTNKNLIGFENGVYDLDKEEFRSGRPDDFISLSTKLDYIEWNNNKKEVKKYKEKLDNFFNQVLTDPEVRRYFLLSLASCCSGQNKEQKFRTITGSGSSTKNGSNGKSLTMSLFAKALGQYYAACPITIITRKRNASNQASPELARLKGVRAGVFQETDENENLNVGIIKEMTGNDKFLVRAMYQEPFEMQFQAKFFLQCNKLPVINAQDYGTWRRIRVIEFSSRFVETPDPNKPNEFLLNSNLEYEIDTWAPYFMSYLIYLYVSEYKKEKFLTEPEAVKAFTDKYRNENDSIRRFFSECVVKDPSSNKFVTNNAFWERYRDWIKDQADESLKSLSRADFDKLLPEVIGEEPHKSKGWKNFIFKASNNAQDDSDEDNKANDLNL
jgi:P4 family phage/plasmid primase-like protien